MQLSDNEGKPVVRQQSFMWGNVQAWPLMMERLCCLDKWEVETLSPRNPATENMSPTNNYIYTFGWTDAVLFTRLSESLLEYGWLTFIKAVETTGRCIIQDLVEHLSHSAIEGSCTKYIYDTAFFLAVSCLNLSISSSQGFWSVSCYFLVFAFDALIPTSDMSVHRLRSKLFLAVSSMSHVART